MQHITAESLRSDNTAAARQRLSDLLSSPTEHSEALLDVMTDRGLRDALLCVTIQTGRFGDLQTAAEHALGVAIDKGRSPFGPIVITALLAWAGGMPEYGAALAATVPEGDPARRMASLVGALASRGMPASLWFARMEALDLADCLAFKG